MVPRLFEALKKTGRKQRRLLMQTHQVREAGLQAIFAAPEFSERHVVVARPAVALGPRVADALDDSG